MEGMDGKEGKGKSLSAFSRKPSEAPGEGIADFGFRIAVSRLFCGVGDF